MSTIGDALDTVIGGDLARRLKQAGYRKSGRTFYAAFPNHTCVVNIQASKWNAGNDGQFTINLGVHFAEVARLSEAFPVKGAYPKEYDCTIRVRLGALMHEGRDVWWAISSKTDLSELATRVGTAWAVFGKPWLERMSTLEGLHAELVNQKAYYLAANTSLLRGQKNEAEALLRKALEWQPRAATKLRAWGEKYGLLRAAI